MNIENVIQDRLREFYKNDVLVFDKSRFAGGMTNYNYIMEIEGQEYVIRQPGTMTHVMIDRKAEKVNNLIASELGINSECVYFDDEIGMKISIYIDGSKDIGRKNPSDRNNIDIVLGLIKKLHTSNKIFPNVFDWEVELEKYEELVLELNGELFFDYIDLKKDLLEFICINVKLEKIKACHNDTVPENFVIDKNNRGYLIDWEYSGMNDPAWDLAAYILESRLTKGAIDYLLLNYYGDEVSNSEIIKIKSYMMAQDLLWTVWAMVRHYSGDDFLEYLTIRYERFKKNLTNLKERIDYPIYEMVN